MKMHKLDKIASELHSIAVEKGFWDNEATLEMLCTKLLLIHSEVTEVTEALRKQKGPLDVAEEMADILIRTLDLYQGMYDAGWVSQDLSTVMEYKHNKNKDRKRLHGNVF